MLPAEQVLAIIFSIGLLSFMIYALSVRMKTSKFGVDVKDLANLKNVLYIVRKNPVNIVSEDEKTIELTFQSKFDSAMSVMPTVFNQFPYVVTLAKQTDDSVDTGSVFLAINGKSTTVSDDLDTIEIRKAVFDLVAENYF